MKSTAVKEGILYLLQGDSSTFDGVGFTLEEIIGFLELNGLKMKDTIKLKELLFEMEKEELIEERNFDFSGKNLGRIDYSIMDKGIKLVEKKLEELKKAWKI